MPAVPPEQYRFKPGQSGNPSGKRRRLITHEKVTEIIERLSLMTCEELIAMSKDMKTPVIEMQLASVMATAVTTGDPARVNAILDRLVGRSANTAPDDGKAIDAILDKVPMKTLESYLKDVG